MADSNLHLPLLVTQSNVLAMPAIRSTRSPSTRSTCTQQAATCKLKPRTRRCKVAKREADLPALFRRVLVQQQAPLHCDGSQGMSVQQYTNRRPLDLQFVAQHAFNQSRPTCGNKASLPYRQLTLPAIKVRACPNPRCLLPHLLHFCVYSEVALSVQSGLELWNAVNSWWPRILTLSLRLQLLIKQCCIWRLGGTTCVTMLFLSGRRG